MFSITIEGETLDDVTIRVIDVYKALTGRPAPKVVMPAAEAPNAPETDPPAATTKAPAQRRKRKSQAEIAAELPGETIVEPDAEHHEVEEEEFDRVAAAGIKEAALDKIRAVYSLGAAGVDAVNELVKKYGEKKLSSVPLEKAGDLMNDISAIEKKLSA